MGNDDLILKIKYQFKDNYRPYVSVDINDINPNGRVPDWDLVMDKRKAEARNIRPNNPYDWNTKLGKRNASRSPEDRSAKRSNREEVDDFQIAEFIHAFLEGTATKPRYENLNWSLEAGPGFEEESSERRSNPDEDGEVMDGAVQSDLQHGAAPAQAESPQGAAPAQTILTI